MVEIIKAYKAIDYRSENAPYLVRCDGCNDIFFAEEAKNKNKLIICDNCLNFKTK